MGLVTLAGINKSNLVMKVAEYVPRYGLLRNLDHTISVQDKKLPVKELLKNYPDLELTPDHVEQLDTIDLSSLYTGLNHIFVNEEIIIAILQNLLDAYIQRGGDSLTWLSATFQSFHEHPQYFSPELRRILEGYLVKMMHNLTFPATAPSTGFINPKSLSSYAIRKKKPAFNTLLEAFNNVSEYQQVMGPLQKKNYCTANGSWQDYKSGWKLIIIALIKWLAIQGYCRKTKFTTSEIQAICENTFNTEKISFSTITHVHPSPVEFSHLFDELKNTISGSLLLLMAFLCDFAWIADCLECLDSLFSIVFLVCLSYLIC